MMRSHRRLLATRLAVIAVVLGGAIGCAKDWPAFRQGFQRTAQQRCDSPLADPTRVPGLAVRWTYPSTGTLPPFRASPVVSRGRVFVGNSNGRLYALDAHTGALLWQYPPAASPALTSQFTCNPSSEGLASSAVIAKVNGTEAVIFGAPDRSIGTGLGEGRLFALNAATGAELWKSPVIARLTGTSSGSTTEFHEQIGYSSPIVFNDRVYVGIANHCDNPIQKGRAADLSARFVNPSPTFVMIARGLRIHVLPAQRDEVHRISGAHWNPSGTLLAVMDLAIQRPDLVRHDRDTRGARARARGLGASTESA
jgi:PQQ-like domain